MKKLTKAMYGKSMMKNGGMKKMANGGPTTPGDSTTVTIKKGSYSSPSDYQAAIDSTRNSGKTVYLPKEKSPASWSKQMKGGSTKSYKTGGMVNSNTKVMASKIAKGRSGGTSKAPKKAIPKAMYGASMDPNMMKPGMMKMGGSKKK